MSSCRTCGLPLKFIQRLGRGGRLKWFPANPDGSDHWDTCKTVVRKRSGLIRHDGSLDWNQVEQAHPTIRTYPANPYTHQWIGVEPPWDESLGEFRDFTEEEKAQRQVCAPFDRMRAS